MRAPAPPRRPLAPRPSKPGGLTHLRSVHNSLSPCTLSVHSGGCLAYSSHHQQLLQSSSQSCVHKYSDSHVACKHALRGFHDTCCRVVCQHACTPNSQPHATQAIDALLSRHASNDDASIVSGLGVADEPPPITSASQVRQCASTAVCTSWYS